MKQKVTLLLLSILLFAACASKEKEKPAKNNDNMQALLAGSKYLYIINDSTNKQGLMNEKGEIVMPLQDERISQLDDIGHYFTIGRERLFSIKEGFMTLKIDSLEGIRPGFRLQGKTYFAANINEKTYLIDEKGTKIHQAAQYENYAMLNETYYYSRANFLTKFFNSKHEQLLEIDSVAGFVAHKTDDNLLYISYYNSGFSVLNLKNKKEIKFKKLISSYAFFEFSSVFDSYWQSTVDSFPLPIVTDAELSSMQNQYKASDLKVREQKVFQFFDKNLNPLSDIKYAWNEINAIYNPYGRISFEPIKKQHFLWQDGKRRSDLPAFSYLTSSANAGLTAWMLGKTTSNRFVMFYKGKNLPEIAANSVNFMSSTHFIVLQDDKTARSELRDSNGLVVIAAAKQQRFFPILEGKTKEAIPNLVAKLNNDSLTLLDLSSNKVLVFIPNYGANNKSIQVLRYGTQLFFIGGKLLYNSEKSEAILSFADTSSFVSLGTKGMTQLSDNLISYELEGYSFSERTGLTEKKVLRLLDMQGNSISKTDFSNYRRELPKDAEKDRLFSLSNHLESNTYEIKYYFKQDGTLLWPKKALPVDTVDFVLNWTDLEKRLNNAQVKLQELPLEKLTKNNWVDYLYTETNIAELFKDIDIVQLNFTHINNKTIQSLFLVGQDGQNPFNILNDYNLRMQDNFKSGNLLIMSNIITIKKGEDPKLQPMMIYRLK